MQPTKRDHGYAWVILVATFINNGLGMSVMMSAAVYMVDWVEYYEATNARVGLAGSMISFMGCFTGLFGGPLLDRFGCRLVTILGTVIVILGLVLTSFATSLEWIYVTYSIVTGFGLGLTIITPLVLVQYYFDKKRAFASGISLMGHSCGTFIMLPVLRLLIQHYGWRGAILIHAAIASHILVIAGLYRPPVLPELEKKKRQKAEETTAQNKKPGFLKSFWIFLKNLWDFRIFKNVVFVQYLVAILLFQFGGDLMYKFTPLKGVSMGLSKVRVALFPSILGFSSTCARIFTSIVGNLKCTKRILMQGTAAILGGIAMLFFTLAVDFISMAVLVGAYGLLLGMSMTLLTTVLVDLIGIGRLAQAQAFMNGSIGLVLLVNITLAGYIVDQTNNYNIPYYLYGSFCLVGGILMVTIPITEKVKGSAGDLDAPEEEKPDGENVEKVADSIAEVIPT